MFPKTGMLSKRLASFFRNGSFGYYVPSSVNLVNNSRRFYVTKVAQEPFLNGSSSVYVEEMYKAWLANPSSVHQVSNAPKKCLFLTSYLLSRLSLNGKVMANLLQECHCRYGARTGLSKSGYPLIYATATESGSSAYL